MTDTPPPVPPADNVPPVPPAAPQPAPTPPVYAQPGPPQGYAAPPTNTMAIVALVLAFIVPLVGAILGHVALGQIKRTGESGHGLALAGVIIGWVFTAIAAIAILFYIVAMVSMFALIGSSTSFVG